MNIKMTADVLKITLRTFTSNVSFQFTNVSFVKEIDAFETLE